jgi:hypothetical protein
MESKPSETAELYPEFQAGIYKHYKGPLYLVLGLGHDANYEDRVAVIYVGLELDEAKTGPRLAIRTYDDFYSYVDENGQTVDKDSPGARPRLEFIGNSWEGQH